MGFFIDPPTDHDNLGRLEPRIARLEREVRRWRLASGLAAGVLIAGACNSAAPPTMIEFRSEDGLRSAHIDADGLWVKEGARSGRFAAGNAFVRDGDLGLSLAPDRVSMVGANEHTASMGADSIAVSCGTANARIAVEGGDTGIVRATGEHATATLGATGADASLALRGETATRVDALINGTLADVAVTNAEDRVAHLRAE